MRPRRTRARLPLVQDTDNRRDGKEEEEEEEEGGKRSRKKRWRERVTRREGEERNMVWDVW